MNVIAIHEAAHAVVATYHGLRVESMKLRSDSGTTMLSEGTASQRALAAFAYAGLAAEREVDSHANFDRGCMSDLRAITRYTSDWSDDALDAFYAGTIALVRMLWPFIKTLAGVLAERGELTGKQVSAILCDLPQRRRDA